MFYNLIEIYDPILDFFPEITDGKVYKMTIITDVSEFDVPLLCNAQRINEILLDEFDDLELSIKTEYNERYLPNKEPLTFEKELESFAIIDNLLMMRDDSDYKIDDYVVCDNMLKNKDDVVCSIATINIDQPPSTKEKLQVH